MKSSYPIEQLAPWKARWSWIVPEETQNVSAVWARAKISLPAGPVKLPISASHFYRMWWNKTLVGRGPDRTDPRYLYGDVHDVTAESGVNEIVVLVYHFKAGSGAHHRNWCLNDGPPGLIAEIVSVDTGDSIAPIEWEMRRSEAWNSDAPLSTRFRGPIQDVKVAVYDGELAEAFAGKGVWTPSVSFDFGHNGFYPEPMANETPRLREETFRPLTVTRFLPTANTVANHRSLFGYMPENVLTATSQDGGPWLVFEFREEFTGFPFLEVEGEGTLDVYYGEGCSLGRQDRLHLDGSHVCYEGMDWRGGRFLALNCSQMQTPLKVHRVEMLDQQYPYENRGSFRCESALWNKIWTVCRETARVGVREHPLDCAREQSLWIEDVAIHIQTVRACFGEMNAFRKGFLQAMRPMLEDGLVPVPGPSGTGYDKEGETLRWSTFPLSLPRILRELLVWNPDADLAEWGLSKIERVLEFFAQYEEDRGLILSDPEDRQHLEPFNGWNPSQTDGVNCGTNALYLAALDHGAEAAAIGERQDLVVKWKTKAEKLRHTIFDAFWMPERMLFSNGEKDGKRVDVASPTVNAWCALTGVLPAYAVGSWAQAVTKDPIILPYVSSYDATVMLMAFAHHGLEDGVRNLMEGYFGSIVRANQPYIPEYWQEHGKTTASMADDSSRCHPFGSGPGFVLLDFVLGVKPMEPGWKHIRVEPHAAGLWQASGRVPSPHGDISIFWERNDFSWEMELEIPKGMTADVRLPRLGSEQQELRVNEKVVAVADYWKEYVSMAMQKSAAVRTTFLECKVGAGHHRISTRTC